MRYLTLAVTVLIAALSTLTPVGGTALADKKPKPTSHEWVDSLRALRVEGGQLVLLEHGTGDPVVLIHGTMADYRTWLAQIDPLSYGHRVVAYSRRYHFPNQGGGDGRDYSMALHEKDLVSLIDALGAKQVSLVGHSYGAVLAARYAVDHPERVKALVLCEPTFPALMAGTEKDSQFVAERRLVNERARQALSNDFPELGAQAIAEWAFGPEGLDAIPKAERTRLAQNAASMKYQYLTPIKDEQLGCEKLKTIKCPVLYIDGSKSPWHAKAMADEFVKCRPETRRLTLKASHGMMWSDAKGFNKAVLEFLDHPAMAND